MATALAPFVAPTVGARRTHRARRDRASRAAALVACGPAPSPPLSPPPSLSERSGGGSAEKRDRSCGADWGGAARRGRSDHGCSHCVWLGSHRGCNRPGQAAAVVIAEVCMPSLCPHIPSHAIPARKRACHSVRVSVFAYHQASLCFIVSVSFHRMPHARGASTAEHFFYGKILQLGTTGLGTRGWRRRYCPHGT